MDSEGRTRDARARAERALVELALAFGDHAADLIVIGGLNPDFLAPSAPAAHLGTTDVDILLELGATWERDETDFSWLAPALRRGGFEPKNANEWQWERADGSSVVRVDLLCDVDDNRDQPIALPGAQGVAAQNLSGPSGALFDPVVRSLPVDEIVRERVPDAPPEVVLRFASLGGYLLAKSSALVNRRLSKDCYDVMYVILHNPAGPVGAAHAITAALHAPAPHHDHRLYVSAALQTFVDDDSAERFASEMRASGDDATEEQLALDARRAAAQVLGLIG